ncbi:hypothetical protein OMP38_13295 [Cohnella ginsengisoli]|uniref:Uncharacterized protein n=1 Tax=Cohnella ginsengisoli TaxID=425004 RepID=A0A9X4KGG9_9BACL|nr:hypothetical protein [Cohnella ginsengisoli]MDG0791738.1 hypothetical protein [Cohnella ginsengisoli]
MLIVFGEALADATGAADNGELPEARQHTQSMDISDRWTLRIPEAGFEQALEQLQTWERFADVRYYCGSAFL